MYKAELIAAFDQCLLTDKEMFGAITKTPKSPNMEAWKLFSDPFPAWN